MKKIIGILAVAALFTGCFAPVQVSSLKAYGGERSESTESCKVVSTSFDELFDETVSKNKEFVLGDSHVETYGLYEIPEAAFDCMVVGAKSVLVLQRGIISTTTTHHQGATTYSYNSFTKTVTANNFDYDVTRNTSGYVAVFFRNEISNPGRFVTLDDYLDWKKKNRIDGCQGCDF